MNVLYEDCSKELRKWLVECNWFDVVGWMLLGGCCCLRVDMMLADVVVVAQVVIHVKWLVSSW